MQTVGMRAKALRLLAAGGVAAAVMLPGAAMAQVTNYGGGSQNPSGANAGNGSADAGAAGAQASGGTLPFTGGDVAGLALIGAGAVFGGAVLVRSGRRRQEA